MHDLVHLLRFLFVLLELVLKHLDLAVFLLNHFLLPLCIIESLCGLFCFAFRNFQFVHEALALFLAAHQSDVELILLLPLLVQDALLLIQSLLQSCLLFLDAACSAHIITRFVLLLLLQECTVLYKCLLEDASQSHALLHVGLHLVIILTRLTHLYILFQLVNLPIFHLALKFKLAVLSLKLLYEERL